MKEFYPEVDDFKKLWQNSTLHKDARYFHIHEGFHMKDNQLCIHILSNKDKVIRDLHGSGLSDHFRRDKTLAVMEERLYWSYMQ